MDLSTNTDSGWLEIQGKPRDIKQTQE